MEWFLIALTGLLTAITPVGLVVDHVIANNIRDRVKSVEELSVRVDNSPSYQLIQGKISRVRIAGRGIEPINHVRIDTLDIETDPIDVKVNDLKTGNLEQVRGSLRSPLQGAFNLIIPEDDINKALAEPQIKSQIQALLSKLLPSDIPTLEFMSAKVTLKAANRAQVELQLQQKVDESEPPEKLEITVETGVKVIEGRSLELIDPTASLNGRKISQRILQGVLGSISDRLTLKRLEKYGIIARVLELQLDNKEVNVAAFVRLNPLETDSSKNLK
jgi:hypothetical protein